MAENGRGKFVWYELMTTDPEAAKEFYTDVVGWGTQPFEHAQGMDYTMWMKGESAVGGLMEMPEEVRKSGAPPHWIGYVAVPDVDATAARAKELGGTVYHGPQDIPEVGRFAVIGDPQGAVLSAFRGTQEMPTEEKDPEPGDVSWNELVTTDHEAALDFYSDLYGWEKQDAMDMGEHGVYQMYGMPGKMLGGMYNKTEDMPFPPHWLFYVKVDDVDAAKEKIEQRGGKILSGPEDVPGGGRIVVAQDPQGAPFALHRGPQE
jgi:predicted enzyme related to lactoylglutathione lyase